MGLESGNFDGHAHVFSSSLPMIEKRRYTPDSDALLDDYAQLLRAAELDGALLVQPSFLGTDNRYLINNLNRGNAMSNLNFKGVAVLDTSMSDGTLSQMNDAGIVGIRFNLLGKKPGNLSVDWKRLLQSIAPYNWHVELHIEGVNLAPALNQLLEHCDKVVVDHYGLPDEKYPLDCSGLSAICAAPKHKVFVKLSAPYRVFTNCPSNQAATLCESVIPVLANHIDSSNLLWGSDWPWTQHERKHTYSDTLSWMNRAETLYCK